MKAVILKTCPNCSAEFAVNAKNKRKAGKVYCGRKCSSHVIGLKNNGRKHSEESKLKRREQMLGEKNNFFGKTHSQETRLKISIANIGKHSGENNPNWKGGFRLGHEYLRVTDGRFYHRIVMEEKLGRKLHAWENVHHIDENKFNNHPDNLEVLTNSEHRKLHAATQKRNRYGKFSA